MLVSRDILAGAFMPAVILFIAKEKNNIDPGDPAGPPAAADVESAKKTTRSSAMGADST